MFHGGYERDDVATSEVETCFRQLRSLWVNCCHFLAVLWLKGLDA